MKTKSIWKKIVSFEDEIELLDLAEVGRLKALPVVQDGVSLEKMDDSASRCSTLERPRHKTFGTKHHPDKPTDQCFEVVKAHA